jgi:hypothetical protein
MFNELRVCSIDASAYRGKPNALVLLLVFATVSVILSLSGCAGITSAKGPAGSPAVLSASLSSMTFGNVLVGSNTSQTITLANSGTASVTISQAVVSGAGFSITGLSVPSTISAGQNVSFTAKFSPTSSGAVAGSVSIASNVPGSPLTISLSGTGTLGQPQLTISPANVTFGRVNVGGADSLSVSLTNNGNSALSISQAAASGAGFSLSGLTVPQTINAGASVSFAVQFTPASTGSASGSITISSNAPGSPATIALSGAAVQGTLTATPSSLNFGSVLVGSGGSQMITLTNSGTSTVTISQGGVSGTGFSISGLSTPLILNAAQSASFSATFSPASAGAGSGSISITSNAPGSPLSIALTGAGTQPQLSAAPSSTSFGSVVTGSSNSQTITLTNGGSANTTISQASVSGTGFSMSGLVVPVTIAPGRTTTFNAMFAPSSSGSVTGSVSLVTNAPGSPLAISLSGTGVAATFLQSANPTNLIFGNVNVAGTSSLNTTLTNTGNSNVTISGVTVTGTGFSASGITSGMILAPNQSATVAVAFAPNMAQSLTGSVTVTSNATNSPATVTLSGSGVGVVVAPPTFPVWVTPSLVRVGKADAPGTASSITLSSARGETVDTQVIVQGPSSGLTNVNVSASALTGPGGASLPAASFTLYREYYLSVTGTASYGGGSNPPLGSGTYPEPLIPFNDPETGLPLCGSGATLKACNATVAAGQNQPYWIDISVPRGATNSPSGIYTGSISITADQGNATIPVTLTVWNFELPAQPSELSVWSLWPPATGNTVTTLAQALMRNKVMSCCEVPANASSDMTDFGLNRLALNLFYRVGIECDGSYSNLPSTSEINMAAANFPTGIALDLYVADELNGCTKAFPALKTIGTNAHAANRSVKTMMTANTTDSNLYGAINHWVLLDSVQQWPALPFTGGGDLWSYTSCNAGFGNAPEWMVDYPPINERIQAGFLNWAEGATGILYYRADGWSAGNALGSWNNVDTTTCKGGHKRPGDGIFLYPPGPIASTESAPGIRLKAVRDGIQDYEYVQILKNLGQVAFANSTIQPIATSWSNWSHDPNALENARLQLGQLLNQLSPPR